MHDTVKRYENIISTINKKLEDQKIKKFPKIIAVSKTFEMDQILPLIAYGHLEYGENKVKKQLKNGLILNLKILILNYI
jgi:uncharacterized pyridoxal phosphate-containing UPF0001 family protein